MKIEIQWSCTGSEFALGPEVSERASLLTDMPADVAAFQSRATACYEPMQQALECGELPAEQHALRERYADQPVVLHALDQWFFKVVERVPVKPAP